MKVIQTILIVIACLILVIGINIASGVPGQIFFVSLAIFFMIVARIAQASDHYDELLTLNKNLLKNKSDIESNNSNQKVEITKDKTEEEKDEVILKHFYK